MSDMKRSPTQDSKSSTAFPIGGQKQHQQEHEHKSSQSKDEKAGGSSAPKQHK